ncbi:class I SAM-dependent methyltransferase [bacterium (Candidatus Blackallbacteria) CG17_big_fil_post_rev_8_21_14_2_50_48_46]|uniref:Class I SAM-dependent methyltransferase n=1 Tax=bacterium (Candidatus Blackallbacteria) CG17_big_fil_post_rev_8_21_14_2_50_48_46 TaxID=2014261 RepID=A0A2M7G799_9BACT|nr:MAG: SAM-dependent methyltransferase [bacterium (Candidatus Blackallbacteria) CG18_big_fil_WC_8_21_14_2_50_49_26]PIW17926.1 MAG: class I SAM-dependent methyltransferase [bacterium (Candidatus Blackallbacteria) CG17_big_fil_post_rev_8_21_14_2_50_48_46]PIW45745.1 MAG: class I SAM-dependent methyltransferase [bacterium (Candidatus Blackallbacteria) CG13_big_fil_rev_8_21_14_2_50_49_14]
MTSSHRHASSAQEPKAFWEKRYLESVSRSRGKAGRFLQDWVSGLEPQRVLELGCSTGDDSLWLAEKGWQVTAVDISEHAVQTAQRLAQEAGLSERIAFLNCDLTQEFPAGQFELVSATYFQSPFDFPRIQILKTAASRIVKGGHLLIVTHASAPPWAAHTEPKHEFPKAEEDWQNLDLPESQWQLLKLSVETRLAQGPQGQEAELKDNLIFARRL